MPSPKTAIHISDAVSALLMGHQQRYETSPEVSFSFETYDEANRKESMISEKRMIIPKHGYTIESSPIHAESLSSEYTTNILDTNTSKSPSHPNTDVQTHMEIEAQQSSVLPIAVPQRRPRSGSEGLDYLAFLAEQERHSLELPTATGHPIPVGNSSNNCIVTGDPIMPPQQYTSEHEESMPVACSVVTPPTTIVNNPQTSSSSSSSSSCSDTDDSEAMPPPQPRRPRSISNPDYMMSMQYQQGADRAVALGISTVKSQQHFVLPPHLLREELAMARSAVVRKAAAEITMTPYCYNRYGTSTTVGSSFCVTSTIPEHAVYLQSNNDHYDYGNHTSDGIEEEEEYDDDELRPESGDEYDDDDDVHDEVDTHDTLEDQDVADRDNNIVIPMDASLSSMELLRRARSRLFEDLLSETNTLNGTNDRSITILPHTLSKYKMIYNQNGRIGIYTPQERAAIIARYHAKRAHRNWNKKIRYNCRKNLADRRLRVKGRFVKRSMEDDPQQHCTGMSDDTILSSGTNDQMPDVNDPEAGFCPTIEQPYRRLRRHTVT